MLNGVRVTAPGLLALVIALAGCTKGPIVVPVSGQVLIDGKPLTTGHIQVIPTDERPATGTIGSDGKFRLSTYEEGDGVAPGTHQVVVMGSKQLSPTRTQHLIPPTYADPAASGLTATIDGPTDALKIELSWKGGRPYVEEIHTGGDVAPVGAEQASQ